MSVTTVEKMHPTGIGLADAVRIEMIDLLNRRLAESLDLGLRARHAHWNVRGSQFSALHELFAQLSADLDRYSDLLAERVVQLGGVAEGTFDAVATRSELMPYDAAVNGSDHVRRIAATLASWAPAVRASIFAANDVGDPVTADVVTEISRGVDKWLWLVEAHLASP